MSENETRARIKIMLISMGIRPSRRGFIPLADAIMESAINELPMKDIYEKLSKGRHQSKNSIERSMRLCLDDIDADLFAKEFNEITGFNVAPESMKFSCNSFVGMMSEIVNIAFKYNYGANDLHDVAARSGIIASDYGAAWR